MIFNTSPTRWLGLWLILVLTACDAVLAPAAPAPSSDNTNQNQPDVVQVAVSNRTPTDAFEGFMAAWNQQDIDTLYALISERSRERIPFAEFAQEYETAQTEFGFAGVSYTLTEERLQGESAAIIHDIVIESDVFGRIEDTGRIMRFVQERGGWQVAWTSMDILNGMSSSVRLSTQRRFPPRANIYDRELLPLAEEAGSIVTLNLRKQDMLNEEDCVTLLADVMMQPRSRIAAIFPNYLPTSLFSIGEFDPDIFNANREALNTVCGANVEVQGFNKILQSTGRTYYGHGIATHITGWVGRVPVQNGEIPAQYAGYRETDIVGLAGIELGYERTLAGTPEQFLRLIGPSGQTIRELGGATGTPPTPVVLTIDRDLQFAMAEAFSDAFAYAAINWSTVASGGAAVVMDVNTGEILAMASYPTFDPRLFNPENTYQDSGTLLQSILNDPRSTLSNKAVAEQYAPGSVFKIITTAAATQSDAWQQSEIFNCTLTWDGTRYGDSLLAREDWRVALEFPPAGPITMSEALTTSCNPFFWEVGALMYQENVRFVADTARTLGIGQTTGLGTDLRVAEARGNVPIPGNVTQALNNAIGQGDTQTNVVQMARMVAAFANGGTLYQPYIVRQVGGIDGTELQQQSEPLVLSQLDFDPIVYDVVREGMCEVPTNERLGTSYIIFNDAPYTSCGKTGTAQAGDATSGIPPHSWYVTYAPAENPQVAVAVVVPTSREGSEVATPIARRILDNYFGVDWAPFPEWWENPYTFVPPPQGVTGTAQ